MDVARDLISEIQTCCLRDVFPLRAIVCYYYNSSVYLGQDKILLLPPPEYCHTEYLKLRHGYIWDFVCLCKSKHSWSEDPWICKGTYDWGTEWEFRTGGSTKHRVSRFAPGRLTAVNNELKKYGMHCQAKLHGSPGQNSRQMDYLLITAAKDDL